MVLWSKRYGAQRAALIGIVVVGAACQSPKAPVVAPPATAGAAASTATPGTAGTAATLSDDEAAAQALAAEAERLTRAGRTAAAQARRDKMLKRYPGTAAAAEEVARRAEAARNANQPFVALAYYEKLFQERPTHDPSGLLRERYAELLLQAQRPGDAVNAVRPLLDEAPDPATQWRRGKLLLAALTQAKQGRAALEWCVKLHAAHQDAPGSGADPRVELASLGVQLIDGALSAQEAMQLWPQVENNAAWEFLQPPLALKLAKIYYHIGDLKRCEEMLELILADFRGNDYATQAQSFLTRVRARAETRPKTLGVVLPLSGRYKQYGERALAAIRLALSKYPDITLSVKDSAGEAANATTAVETLVLQEHVLGIIGPLFSNEALAAALKAEELSVVLVALSHREGLPELGPYVFRTALTVQAQAQALARVAFEELGLRRFALLYPRSRYGSDFVAAFWNEVDRRRGEIRGVESYEQDQTTFREPVSKLVGRYFLQARPEYRAKHEEIMAQQWSSWRTKNEIQNLQSSLPPIVDFDALVIPDSGRKVGLITPALAVEDVVLTHDPAALEKIRKSTGRSDIQPIRLLGGSTWNTAQTLDSCDKYCEDAVFVDAYFPDSPEQKVRDFVGQFQEAAQTLPHLNEAQAFDTANMLAQILASQNPASRDELRQQLQKMAYDGVSGKWSFSDSGDAQKQLFTFTIQGGRIRLWQKPNSDTPKG